MRYALLLGLCVLLAGCAQSSVASSSLDRFDMLAGRLRGTTHLSSVVAADVRAINGAMAQDRTRQIRRSAARLERDAAKLEGMTAALQPKVRRVMDGQSKGLDRRYVGLVLGTLWHQRWEAHWAGRLAGTLRRDPLLLSQRSYHAALHQARLASRAAGASVSDANRARALAEHHRGTFGLPPASSTGNPGTAGGI